jgi:hypothetical protein
MLDTNLHFCMDYEFWLRLASRGANFAYIDYKLAGSRIYSQTKTLGSRVGVHAEINDVLHRLFGVVPEVWLYNYAHAVVDTHIVRAHHPRLFVLEVSALSLMAGLKWNGAVSRKMLRTVGSWIRNAILPR